jgi:tRNA1(Val) A37 N6-methylase TrmN6
MMTLRQQRYWLEQARSHWRMLGFPYPHLSESERKREFAVLGSVEPKSILQRNLVKHSTVGLRLANSFHPQMWHVRVHGRSPVEVFEDDDKLIRALRKAAIFWPNRRCWNGQCLRSVLRIMHRQRVSNFRPTVSRALLHKYSGPGETILDFSAGYGGRLLGAMSLDRSYTGIDASPEQLNGLKRTVEAMCTESRAKTRLIQGCSEDILPTWPSSSFSVVFSSPPYFNCEKYSEEATQSYIRYPNYDQWLDSFLRVILNESFRLLEKGGYLILNVANTDRFPIASDAKSFCHDYFGSPTKVLQMLIRRTPSDGRRRSRSPFRWEPVYVFRKK